MNQALDFLKPKLNTVDGKPMLISLETKGAGWSQAMLNRLFEVINGKGMKDRVIVHSARPVEVTYAKNAGFPKRGYVTGSSTPPGRIDHSGVRPVCVSQTGGGEPGSHQ